MILKLCRIALILCCILSFKNSIAQGDVIRPAACETAVYQTTIDSLKQLYTGQGYQVLREAAVQMDSEYEMPIVVPMTGGSLYQFAFIGDPTSRLYEVRMFDYSERQVVYKKNQWGDVDGNVISYSYVPKFTEYHMIKPLQVNKNRKKLCGYVILLKKSGP